MRKFLSYLCASLLLIASTGCQQHHSDTPGASTRPMRMSTTYTCPMHPEVAANEPGKCPKCGMALVAKK